MNTAPQSETEPEQAPAPAARPKITDFAPGSIVRTPKDGAYKVMGQHPWGRHLAVCKDPEGIDVSDLLKQLDFPTDFVRLPARMWDAVAQLYFLAANGLIVDGKNEIAVTFLKDEETFTEWRVVVPTQGVSGGAVHADYDKPCVDLMTGEELPAPNEMVGWIRAGTSHSHHTMGAYYSGTDDRNELPQPGMHIVLGEMKRQSDEYSVIASVVQQKRRFILGIEQLVEWEKILKDEVEDPVDVKAEWFDKIVSEARPGMSGGMYTTYSTPVGSRPGGTRAPSWDDDEFDDYAPRHRGSTNYRTSAPVKTPAASEASPQGPTDRRSHILKIANRVDHFLDALLRDGDKDLRDELLDVFADHGFVHKSTLVESPGDGVEVE